MLVARAHKEITALECLLRHIKKRLLYPNSATFVPNFYVNSATFVPKFDNYEE